MSLAPHSHHSHNKKVRAPVGARKSALFSESDDESIRAAVDIIRSGRFRFPWTLGGGTELLALLRPEEDDIEGKLFNIFSCLNIYSGLLVSGLLSYVLEPSETRLSGTNELTGLPNQVIANWQVLFSHLNLVIATVMMAFTTYMCVFVSCETPRTVLRCASKARGFWVYMFVSFLQVFFITAQACLSAIINLEPTWAKITISADAVVVIAGVLCSQELLFGSGGMFPMASYSWLCVAPVKLVQWLLGDRDVYKRIAPFLIAQASDQLGVEDFCDCVDAEDGDEETSRNDVHAGEQQKELDTFLSTACPHHSAELRGLVTSALLQEGLTLDVLVRTASKAQAFNTLFQALDIGTMGINRGERLLIVNAAVERAAQREGPAEPGGAAR